jgi:phospholipid/cholesterol/gamma-HCH transport system ATP-binding protein
VERRPLIEIDNLWKSFNGQAVLRGVSLNVYPGETLCIIGESGCGKTVLLKHIIGLLSPDKGRVVFDGKDLSGMTAKELAAAQTRFGMVFQGGALFDSLTVGENVAFPLREHTQLAETEIRRRVSEKLGLVGLKGIEEKRPAELSGGMRKRVALARAVALGPEVVLYDEPTTGLDPIMADVINELIVRAQRALKTTAVVVTHDMKSVDKVADRVVMLSGGVIVVEGTPGQIRASAGPVVRQFIEGKAGDRIAADNHVRSAP